MLSILNRFQDEILCDGISADQLDHNIDIRTGYDLIRVTGDDDPLTYNLTSLLHLSIGHHRDDDSATSTSGDLFLIALKDREGAATDSTNT